MILSKIIGCYFQKSSQLAAPKNWIQFLSDLSKKIEGSNFSELSTKKLDLRYFVGRIKPRPTHFLPFKYQGILNAKRMTFKKGF